MNDQRCGECDRDIRLTPAGWADSDGLTFCTRPGPLHPGLGHQPDPEWLGR